MNIMIAADVCEEVFSHAILEVVQSHWWPAETNFRILFVMDPFEVRHFESFIETQPIAQALRENAKKSVDAIATRLQAAIPDHDCNAEVILGRPVDVILEQARSWPADIIFVGSHGRRGFKRLMLGSVSSAVASNAPCSIYVVSVSKNGESIDEGANVRGRRVLVPVVEEDVAEPVTAFLCRHDWPDGTEMKLIYVLEPLLVGNLMAVLPSPVLNEMKANNREVGMNLIEKIASDMRAGLPAVQVLTEVVEGFAAETILESASEWGAELIAVGSHARRGLTRLFLGSVSSAVLHHARCSVLIMHCPSDEGSMAIRS